MGPETLSPAVLTALLQEYQSAQESAEHHDTIAWTVTSVLYGASLLLLASLLQRGTVVGAEVLVLLCSALGVVLAILAFRLRSSLRSVFKYKYQRCKDIEVLLGLKQHSGLKYKEGTAHRILWWCMAALVAVWIAVAALAASSLLRPQTATPDGRNSAITEG